MTDKKKPTAKLVNRKATPAKPAAKRKPAVKKPTIEQLVANGQIVEAPLAETAPAFMLETIAYSGMNEAAQRDLNKQIRAQVDCIALQSSHEYKQGYKAGARAVRVSDTLMAFAAGGAAVAMVFVTLRHYGVF